MDVSILVRTFAAVFLAELGDKTQLATFCFAAEGRSWISVFIGSAAALIVASFLAVLLGCEVSKYVPEKYIKISAGVLFIAIGAWMIAYSGKS
jgi:putative Ca2+/H+ antiporter (TMEM165/GDT1 family)